MQAGPVLKYLQELEARFPPPLGQHHSLTCAQYGSDESGWVDMLCLQFRLSSGAQNFLFHKHEDMTAAFAEISLFLETR